MKLIPKIKSGHILLFLIFLIVLFLRIFFVLQHQNFSDDIAYFHFRHTKFIIENIAPLTFDDLSYGGKDILYPPLFHYIMAFFGQLIGLDLALKIMPEIFISLLVLVVYLVAKQISKDEKAALISALLSGFIPLLIRETLNKISPYSLVLPLMFYMFYCFIKLHENNKYVVQFVLLSFILPLLDPSSIIFIFSLIFYSLILVTESIKASNIRKEAIFFSIFLGLLINFIIFKKAFLIYGFGIVKRSIPTPIYELLFRNISVLALIYFLGIVTLVLGIIGLYYGLFKDRKIAVLLVSSSMLSVMLIVTTKFIDFATGLMFIGISLSILASLTVRRFFLYLQLTRFNNLKNFFFLIIIVVIIVFSVVPSIRIANDNMKNVVLKDEINSLRWLKAHSPKDSIVLSRFNEGHLINAIAERKNLIDSYFLLSEDIESKFSDIEILYQTPFEARALEIIRKYKINYIYLSEKTKKQFGITNLIYTQDKNCFDNVYENDEAKIYKITC